MWWLGRAYELQQKTAHFFVIQNCDCQYKPVKRMCCPTSLSRLGPPCYNLITYHFAIVFLLVIQLGFILNPSGMHLFQILVTTDINIKVLPSNRTNNIKLIPDKITYFILHKQTWKDHLFVNLLWIIHIFNGDCTVSAPTFWCRDVLAPTFQRR